MRYLYNNPYTNDALHLYSCGFDVTAPNHIYGPTVRSGYMLHYILSGAGRFTSENRTWSLSKGDFFFIEQGKQIQYCASETTPWAFFWMGFRGFLATEYLQRCTLSAHNAVFNEAQAGIIKNIFSEIIEVSAIEQDADILVNARLMELLYHLCRLFPAKHSANASLKNKIAVQTMQYIRNHYDSILKIEDIAANLNVDRSWLHRQFKKEFHISPKEYLTRLRINKAAELLCNTQYPVSIIASSVGYADALLFSRIFRNATGLSPSDYRKNNLHKG